MITAPPVFTVSLLLVHGKAVGKLEVIDGEQGLIGVREEFGYDGASFHSHFGPVDQRRPRLPAIGNQRGAEPFGE